jgi:hypothetical protein
MSMIVTTGHLLIFIQAFLGQVEGLLANDGWHGNGDPFLGGGWPLTVTWPHWLQGRFSLACCRRARPPAHGRTGISGRAKDTPDGRHIPAKTARRRWNLLVAELFSHPVERSRRGWVGVPVKDLSDNLGFDRFQAHPAGVTWPFRVEDVAIRRHRPGQQQATAQLGLPASPHPFGNEVALVLSNRAANVQQQLVVGVLTHRSFQKLNPAAHLLQVVHQQHLMNVIASQAIRRGYQNQLKSGHCRMVAQPVQAGPVELGPTVAIIPKDVRFRQTPVGVSGNFDSQPFQLLFNRLTLLLAVGRNSDIQGDLHHNPPYWAVPSALNLGLIPLSSAPENSKRNPNAVDHRNGQQWFVLPAILFSSSLRSGQFHFGGYPSRWVSLSAQPQGPPPPRQLQFAPTRQAEFVICDHTIELPRRQAVARLG